MKSLFAQIRTARDILCNRLPAALAMLKAKDVSIAVGHRQEATRNQHWLTVTYLFDDDPVACRNAYHRVEYLYEMDRDQRGHTQAQPAAVEEREDEE